MSRGVKTPFFLLCFKASLKPRQWHGHDEVVKALKDGSVAQEVKNLGIG